MWFKLLLSSEIYDEIALTITLFHKWNTKQCMTHNTYVYSYLNLIHHAIEYQIAHNNLWWAYYLFNYQSNTFIIIIVIFDDNNNVFDTLSSLCFWFLVMLNGMHLWDWRQSDNDEIIRYLFDELISVYHLPLTTHTIFYKEWNPN